MFSKAESVGIKSKTAEVVRVGLAADLKQIETASGTFLGKTVVLATGAVSADTLQRGINMINNRERY